MLLKNMTITELRGEIATLQNSARAFRSISKEYVRQAGYKEKEIAEAQAIMAEKRGNRNE